MTRTDMVPPRVLVDRDLRLVAVNRAVARLTGVPKDALVGSRLDEWINLAPALRERLREGLRRPVAIWSETIPLAMTREGTGKAVVRLKPLRVGGGHLLISLIAVHLFGKVHRRAPERHLSVMPRRARDIEPKEGARDREATADLR